MALLIACIKYLKSAGQTRIDVASTCCCQVFVAVTGQRHENSKFCLAESVGIYFIYTVLVFIDINSPTINMLGVIAACGRIPSAKSSILNHNYKPSSLIYLTININSHNCHH